jgi:hypothetical protein
MAEYGDTFDPTGRKLTAADIDTAARRRPASAPPAIPGIPLERYDGCSCGRPRFVHAGQAALPADEFGGPCDTGFQLATRATKADFLNP